MSKIERYYKGSNHGGIVETPMGFTASTATKSRAFKTWTGADKWLREKGYHSSENYTGEEPLRRGKKSPKVKGIEDEWWVLTEYNGARRERKVIDYSYKKDPLLARATAKYFDEADSDMMKIYDKAKSDEDLFKKAGYISKDKELYTIDINEDISYEIEKLTPENKDRILTNDRYGVLDNLFEEEEEEIGKQTQTEFPESKWKNKEGDIAELTESRTGNIDFDRLAYLNVREKNGRIYSKMGYRDNILNFLRENGYKRISREK